MALFRGLFVQRDGSNNGTTPKGARLALGGLLGRSSTGTVQTGVLLDGMTPVVSGTGAMTYSIRACAIVTKTSDANGPTISGNDAAVVVETTAAPGSNSRIDTVYALQSLVTSDGGSGTSNEFTIGVVQGTVSATPSAAAIPSGAVALADVTVTSGATTTSGLTFTRRHQWVTANGGIIPDPANSDFGWASRGSSRALVALGSQSQSVNFRAGYVTYGVGGDLDAVLIREGRRVHMMGAMRPSGTLGAATMGPGSATIADIPVGWRPMRNVAQLQRTNAFANAASIAVDTAGVVTIELAAATTYSWCHLSWLTAAPSAPSV